MSELPPLAPNAWLRWDIVRRMLPDRRARVLEIGFGQGGFAARLASLHDYTGVEPDPTSYQVAKRRLAAAGVHGTLINSDVAALTETDAFDVVCAFEVIEHIEDDVKAMTLWSERLRPGGMLLLSTPAWQQRFGPADVAAGHYRRYDPEDMASKLRAAGLVDLTIRHFGMPLGYLLEAARNRLANRNGLSDESLPIEDRTARSGRFFQPANTLAGTATQVGTWPFRALQRGFPRSGPGLIACGRLPG